MKLNPVSAESTTGSADATGKEYDAAMKRYQRKGFTLLELIIVIALFSIIMVSVVKLLDPVSKFHVRSANFETTNACVDNMRRSIEGNLKYADRVRLYSRYAPYQYDKSGGMQTNSDGYAPSAKLISDVQDFYDTFFTAASKPRKFLDCVGTIYVLVFDNEQIASDTALRNYALLSDIADNQLNAGKMVRYEFRFDNYNGGLNTTPKAITPWYVNQKLYGNFEYRFTLGAFNEAAAAGGGAGAGASVFDPSDCTISITLNELKKSPDGLSREKKYQTNSASFSMKNVLDAATKYSTPLKDYITVEKDGTSATDIDHYEMGAAVPRYSAINTPAAGMEEFDGFYFIYTMPETTYDLMDLKDSSLYSAEVADAEAYCDEVHDYEVAHGMST